MGNLWTKLLTATPADLDGGGTIGGGDPTYAGAGSKAVKYGGDTTFDLERESNSTPNAYGLDEIKRYFSGSQADLVKFLATVRKDTLDGNGMRVKEAPSIQDIDGPLPKVVVTYVGQIDQGAPLPVVTRDRQPIQTFSAPANPDGAGGTVSFSYYAYETTYIYAVKSSTRPVLAQFHGPSRRDPTLFRPFDPQPFYANLHTPIRTVCKLTEFAPERFGDYWGITETWIYAIAVDELVLSMTFADQDDSPVDPDPDLASGGDSNVAFP